MRVITGKKITHDERGNVARKKKALIGKDAEEQEGSRERDEKNKEEEVFAFLFPKGRKAHEDQQQKKEQIKHPTGVKRVKEAILEGLEAKTALAKEAIAVKTQKPFP